MVSRGIRPPVIEGIAVNPSREISHMIDVEKLWDT